MSRRDGTAAYRVLLERLDRWMDAARLRHPGVIPCGAGCTACCHGPFDVTIADAELLGEALGEMSEGERSEVTGRAAALVARMRALATDWAAPYDVAALGEERFDRVADVLSAEPCPLLGEDGRCRIYERRPMVCRLIGLPLRSPAGRTIDNACPIQGRFPAYAALPAQPFELEEFELVELECLRGAARRLLGDAGRWEFESTIAALIAGGVVPRADAPA